MATDSNRSWSVYILRCSDGSLYTGITTNLKRRVDEHNESPRGASYTRSRRPVALAFSYPIANRAAASRVEAWIKAQTRAKKEAIIALEQPLPVLPV